MQETSLTPPSYVFWTDVKRVSLLEDPPPEKILKNIQDRPWKGGFEPVPRCGIELHDAEIVKGRIPEDLEGALFRNGSGRIRIGSNRYGHWFDGDGLVTRLCISGETQKATYMAKYVETKRFLAQQRKETKSKSPDDCGFASAGAWTKRGKNGGRFWENIFAIPTNPSNTNILHFNSDSKINSERRITGIYALAEGGPPVEMDPATLETIGENTFKSKSGKRIQSFFSAHYKKDPHTGDVYNHGLILIPKPKINVMKLDSSGNLILQRTSKLPMFSFVHDNMLSENYFILLVQPYEAPLSALSESLVGGEPLGKRFRWNKEKWQNETIAMVYSKETLELVAEVPLPLVSTYHHLNAFEEYCDECYGKTRSTLKFRTLAHDPPETRIELEKAFSDLYSAQNVPLCRKIIEYVIDLKKQCLVSTRNLVPQLTPCELPEMNYGWGYHTKYVYTNAGGDDSEWANNLQKVNLETGECSPVITFGEGVYAGAPIFVPRKNAKLEDEGYIFTQLYNSNSHSTEICILDAMSMEKLVALRLAMHVPFQFHGTWFNHT